MTGRIAHLSDIHFGAETHAAVEGVIDWLRSFAPDVTVVTGDLTLNGKPPEFGAAAEWLARLPAPRVVTPGNHDTPYLNLVLRALTPFDRFRRYIGPDTRSSANAAGLVVRALNSARGAQRRLDWSKGALSIADLRATEWGPESSESGRTEDVRVFACHHPLMELPGAPVTGGVTCGREAALVLDEADVELVLTGHVHRSFAAPLSGEPGRYAIGAGTLSKRTRGEPPSFSTIVVGDEAFEVTQHAWRGEGFVTEHQWLLPRRGALGDLLPTQTTPAAE